MQRSRLCRIALVLASLTAGGAPLNPAIAGSRVTAPADTPAPAAPDTFRPPVAPRRTSAFQPGEALAIGLIATAAPVMLAANAGDRRPVGSRSGMVVLGAAAGVVAGPAIGLAWGGRGDLAGRGLAIRAAGLGLATLGVLGLVGNMEDSSTSSAAGGLGMLILGGAVTCISAAHDLAITPSAVGEPRPRAALGVRPDGKVAVNVTF